MTSAALDLNSGGAEILELGGHLDAVFISVTKLTIDTKAPSVYVTVLIEQSRVLLATVEVSHFAHLFGEKDLLRSVNFVGAAGNT